MRAVLALLVTVILLGTVPAAASDAPVPERSSYIVSLSPAAIDAGISAQAIAERYGAPLAADFPALHQFSLLLTADEAGELQADADVSALMPDGAAYLADVEDDIVNESGDVVDPRAGIERIHADQVSLPAGVDPSDVNVAVLDTGVSSKQPALNVVGGYNCLDGNQESYGDVKGHGSHVAGIIGARDMGSGPRGVIPGASIWSIRVFDSDGNSTLSKVLCGLNWVAEHADTISVVNFSAVFAQVNTGACGVTSNGNVIDPVHQAICQIVDDLGIPFITAGGNFGSMSSYVTPAAYTETIAVGAIVDTDGQPGGLGPSTKYGQDDTRALFSNYGPTISIFAPGANILSTTPLGGYVTMSGTSMATPFVTGAVALYRVEYPAATPDQIKNALIASGDPGRWSTQPLLDLPRLLATDPSVVPDIAPVRDPLAFGRDGLPVR
ncbi:MAG TPA: S8 family serine peptidase [Nitrolancea sp.]|nr:S8 family serine peptidase [Nitrolancea sp.]